MDSNDSDHGQTLVREGQDQSVVRRVAVRASGIGRYLWAEFWATSVATASQTWRLVCYGSGLVRLALSRRSLRRAQLDLGGKLYQVGSGDPTLRDTIRQLDEQIKTASEAKRSTSKLVAERREQLIHLAESSASAGGASSTEPEHNRVQTFQQNRDEDLHRLEATRIRLWPSNAAETKRVVAGAGMCLLVLVAVIILVSRHQPRPGSRADDDTSTEMLASGKEDAADARAKRGTDPLATTSNTGTDVNRNRDDRLSNPAGQSSSEGSAEQELPPTLDVSGLVTELRDADPGVRQEACTKLKAVGAKGRDAIPALIAALEDQEQRVRIAAAGTLGAMGPAAKAAIPTIVAQIVKGKLLYADVRQDGTLGSMLGHLPPPHRSREDRFVGLGPRSALLVLRDIGGIDAVCELVRHEDSKVRIAGLDAIERLAPANKVVEIASALMSDESSKVRSIAHTVLNRWTSYGSDVNQAKAAVPALIRLLERAAPDGDYRNNPDGDWKRAKRDAAQILARLGPLAKDAVPSLLAMLDDSVESNRQAALDALIEIGDAPRDAVKAEVARLTKLLETSSVSSRTSIIHALGRIGPDAKDAVPVILRVVTSNEGLEAIVAFGRIGPGAEPALPYLIGRLRGAGSMRPHSSLYYQDYGTWIAHTIARVGKASVPFLVEVLGEENAKSADYAKSSLAEIGEPAIPAVVAALKSVNPLMVERAASALVIFSEQQPASIAKHLDAVIALLSDGNYKVRLSGLNALGALGTLAEPAIPQVEKLRQDSESKQVRETADQVWRKLREG